MTKLGEFHAIGTDGAYRSGRHRRTQGFCAAVIGRADKGTLLTTGLFAAGAVKEATGDGASTINLIDGDACAELLTQLGRGVHKGLMETFRVDEKWFAGVLKPRASGQPTSVPSNADPSIFSQSFPIPVLCNESRGDTPGGRPAPPKQICRLPWDTSIRIG